MIFQQQKMHESKELGILQSINLDIREANCDSNKIKKTNSVSLVSLAIPYVSGWILPVLTVYDLPYHTVSYKIYFTNMYFLGHL